MDKSLALLGLVAVLSIIGLVLMVNSAMTANMAAVTGNFRAVTSYRYITSGEFGAFSRENVVSCFDACEEFVYGTPDHRACYVDCLQLLRQRQYRQYR